MEKKVIRIHCDKGYPYRNHCKYAHEEYGLCFADVVCELKAPDECPMADKERADRIVASRKAEWKKAVEEYHKAGAARVFYG